MKPDATAITTDGLTRDFGPVRALDGLSVSIPRGAVVGLLGHNGAGKTTTIRVLNGLLWPTAGSVRVLGLDPASNGADVRARTGVLTETPSLDERLTARENLAFAAQIFGVPSAMVRSRVAELLDRFELSDRADDRAGGFSRGMKQRLALARALVHDPELVFLDEPTAALDPVAARDVHQLIRGYARDERRTVVITTHNLVEAQRLCDRVVILRQGRPIADGTPADLARQFSSVGRIEIEIDAEDREAALRVARASLDGAEVRLDGNTLIADGVGRDRLPALIRQLATSDIALYRVDPTEPSLEDVYFALHEAGDAR